MDLYSNNYLSSVKQMQDFLCTNVWKDILTELKIWEKRIVDELCQQTYNPSSGTMEFKQPERVMFDEMLRGNLKGIREAMNVPNTIIEILLQEQEDDNQERREQGSESDE